MVTKPTHKYKPTGRTIRYTGVRETHLREAPLTKQALINFIDWIGTDDYYLCVWGQYDIPLIDSYCKKFKLETNWLKNINDLQQIYSEVLSIKRLVSRQDALAENNIEYVGRNHKSFNDAWNTSRLLLKYKDMFKLRSEGNQALNLSSGTL